MSENLQRPHIRTNLLTGEKILVSPHRSLRPWQGQLEDQITDSRPIHDANCYLCPGNTRSEGQSNPDFKDTFIFINDFSALLPDTPPIVQSQSSESKDLLQSITERGICKVIVFSPRHDLTLPEMTLTDIVRIIDVWQEEFLKLKNIDWIKNIQIFENKGAIMGCSNPHPHGQIWAQESIPTEIERESIQFRSHYQKHGSSLLTDYIQKELQAKNRIVIDNTHFVALVPFWAAWPYETIIVSKRHLQHIGQFTTEEKEDLALTIRELTIRYDNIFKTSFPYSAGIHQSPVNNGNMPEWHWHMHFYPPLLRSASVKKFMVGYEMLANPQRDITPEFAAEVLRSQPCTHYKSNS